MYRLHGNNRSRRHNRDILFHFERRERERDIVTKDWRHTARLRAYFANFLTRSRKGKVSLEIASKRERRLLGGQKCCVVVSDEITGLQIRGPLSGEFITEMRVQKCALSAMRVSRRIAKARGSRCCLLDAQKIKTSFIEFQSMNNRIDAV